MTRSRGSDPDRVGGRLRSRRCPSGAGPGRRRGRRPHPGEVALDVPGIQADEHDRDDPATDRQVRRQEGRADGQRVADEEVAQVVRQDAGVDRQDVVPVERRARNAKTPMPVTNIASVESMNGAPKFAPTPISCEPSAVAKTIAMIGMSVSGNAVPTAASTDPTAPSPRPSLRPIHSMPLVNSSAANRMTTRLTSRTRTSVSIDAPGGRDHAPEDGISVADGPAGSRRRPAHATSGSASIGASSAE